MLHRRFAALPVVLSIPLALCVAADPGAAGAVAGEVQLASVTVDGLHSSVRVRRDQFGVPHIFAHDEHDALFVLGWVHAEDRFFQMDLLRHTFSGTLAELLGPPAVPQDVQFRTLGLGRAATASLAEQSAGAMEWLGAYAAGVNAFLTSAATLPPEYVALEISPAGIRPWTAHDSLVIAKGLAFGLSFDLDDLDYTEALLSFQAAGAGLGFDGTALFSEDLYRTAPFDPTVSIPGAIAVQGGGAAAPDKRPAYLGEATISLIGKLREKLTEAPALERLVQRRYDERGSNWWVFSGARTDRGVPMLANDPHLALDFPSTFYEAQLRVRSNGDPPMNVGGVSFPGTPGVILGCSHRACWGATVHPMDVTDVYQEELVVDPLTALPTHTLYRGTPEPLVVIPQTFFANVVGDGTPDNLVDAGVGPDQGGLTFVVPRRNHGPLIAIQASGARLLGLSVQYTGWGATHELDALRGFARAFSPEEFATALQSFDVGSQNWAYADVSGNIAYFTSAELPIREDLQNLNFPDGGIPPFLVRDGTGALQHEWLPVANPQPGQALPFEILPFAEMPQVVNPPSGFILNANNDPIGTSLDNNPLNQLRPGGGLYYLSPGYASGFRIGRIARLVDDLLQGGGKVTQADLEAIQANNQLLDAEVLVPHLLNAFSRAVAVGADPALAALGGDPAIAEAIGRLAAWDFSTPTGIPEGWDPGDDPSALPAPDATEIASSVAATLYSTWRGQAVQTIIDGTLAQVGLENLAPPSSLAMSALRNLLDRFPQQQGLGSSGLAFLQVPALADPEDARDIVLLDSLKKALDLLASDDFAPAFDRSRDQDDYRWGKLHRITFDHPLGGPFSLPPAAGFQDLGPDLPGLARAGGFGAVDASSHGARADGLQEFRFGSGPSRRFVGVLDSFPEANEVIPGGESGVLGSPFQADQLTLWLTNRQKRLPLAPDDVVASSSSFQLFVPSGSP